MGEVTQEDLDNDAALRRAWEDAGSAVQARIGPPPPPEPTHSVDVHDLPSAGAPEGVNTFTDPHVGPQARKPQATPPTALERANRFANEHPVLTGHALDALRPTPTEDTDNPALLARRNAGETAEQAEDHATGATPDVAKTDDPNRDSAGSYGRGGGGGVLIPGGMIPDHEKRLVKHGHVVAPGVRAALGKAGQLEMEGAEIARDADAQLYQQEHAAAMAKVHANETAAAAQQRLAEDRDRMVSTRLAEIETLNKKAQGAPEDIWSSPHVFARMAGFLALACGTYVVAKGGKGAVAGIPIAMSGQFVQGLVNEDIQSKIDERRQAGKAAGRQVNLLHLHEERMGSQSKAIEATKMAYYDNILQQMEAYKADHAGLVNEANFNGLQAQILKKQAEAANNLGKQEQADVTDELVNKYQKPQVVGAGGGGPTKDIPHQVRLSDGTTYALPTEALHKEAVGKIQMYQELQAIDNEALQVRGKLAGLDPVKDREAFNTQKGILERLGQDRLNVTSVAQGQGVVNASDRKAEDEHGTAITSGYGTVESAIRPVTGKVAATLGTTSFTDQDRRAGDAGLRAEIKRKDMAQQRLLDAARARVIEPGYNVDPATGERSPVASYTGRDRTPPPALAPGGSVPRDKKVQVYPTSEASPAGSRTPEEPVLSRRPTDLPTPSSHHSKKKKK